MISLLSVYDTEKMKLATEKFLILEDSYPVSPGHLIIVARRDGVNTYFDLTTDEREELNLLIVRSRQIIERKFNLTPDGYNIGMNCGEAAGQTVKEFHCHVIPRYKGDMEDPKGGIRHCVTGKGKY